MKEKLEESFIEEQSFIQEDEQFKEEQKNQSLDNLQKNAEKTEEIKAPKQEVAEKKISESFPVSKEKISTPGGNTPTGPATVEVVDKYAAIEGTVDKDYDNVIETWNVYKNSFQDGKIGAQNELDQIKRVETNASRYTRWKFSLFMSSKSVKYKRFQQVKDLEAHAKTIRKRLEKTVAKQKEAKDISVKFNDRSRSNGDDLAELHGKRSLAMRILTTITGTFHQVFSGLGNMIAGTQLTSDVRENYVLDNLSIGEIHAQFLNDLFSGDLFKSDLKKKRLSKEKQYTRLDNEEINNKLADLDTVTDEQYNDYVDITEKYDGMLKDKRELLAEYKKKSRNADKIAKLEEAVKKKQGDIEEYNENAPSELIMKTGISDQLDQEIRKAKYRK
ncbi:MAG: hypothetical protein K6A69_08375 [Lachnospiraceae bacterium]|nr:hypothetical protein [Lachnospiraceae bacterium]